MATPTRTTHPQSGKKIVGIMLGVFLTLALVGVGIWQMRPRYNDTATEALLEASRSQDTTALREAIQAGADPNARFRDRRTFLGMATLWVRSLSPLRPSDALFARRELSHRPHTALTQAIQAGAPEAVSALLNAGANPNQSAGHQWPPLAYAANVSAFMPESSLAITRLLLAAGADPNQRDADGATPLLVALYSRASEPIIRLLLEAGADTNIRMSTGATVKHFLNSGTKPEVIRLFREREKSPAKPRT